MVRTTRSMSPAGGELPVQASPDWTHQHSARASCSPPRTWRCGLCRRGGCRWRSGLPYLDCEGRRRRRTTSVPGPDVGLNLNGPATVVTM
jgi:hypothetical protein